MDDQLYMSRCLQLAAHGRGKVAPNPLVGAVLVHDGRLIGEGYHQRFGGPHAEVNCINSVAKSDLPLIPASTLYVNLEPCSHFGKTPPCADLIITRKIPEVVIGITDPFSEVNGRGIKKLNDAGITVRSGVMEKACMELNRPFLYAHQYRRPYVILKWAQSSDGFIAGSTKERIRITNERTNRIVHKWRGEIMSIMVGRNTVQTDDPELTTRYWPGEHPIRIVVDPGGNIHPSSKVLDQQSKTIVFGKPASLQSSNVEFIDLEASDGVNQILSCLYEKNIQSIMVEGGRILLQSFIDQGLWDEARVITNEQLFIGEGVRAPVLTAATEFAGEKTGSDHIMTFIRSEDLYKLTP